MTADASCAMMDTVAAIVIPNCATSGCHDSITQEHGMDLSTAAKIHEAWINKRGLDHCRITTRPRVVPGSPSTSYLMVKLTGAETCELSDRMPPPPRGALTAEQIEVVRAWIAAGACFDNMRADSGPIDDGEAGSADTTVDNPADMSSDDVVDATRDAEAGPEGDGVGPVVDGSSSSDAKADVDDALSPPDSNPCSEAGARSTRSTRPKTMRREPPPGFVMPAGGEQIDCTATKPCPPTMMCIGGGCDDVWQCYAHAPAQHPCPTDYEPYCGCDGVTFMAIRSCPDRPYARVGACEDGVSCDPTRLRCSEPEPPCPEGQVPSVVEGRYGACVPINYCQCEFVWECPHRDKYKCDVASRRCTTLPVDP